MAWTFISAASNLCHTLGYNRSLSGQDSQHQRVAETQLFWTMYKMEKSLALRLGRASTIRDSDITLRTDPDEPRFIELGRIQGSVYDRLYSPGALSKSAVERGNAAEDIAVELRKMIIETHNEIVVSCDHWVGPRKTFLMRLCRLPQARQMKVFTLTL